MDQPITLDRWALGVTTMLQGFVRGELEISEVGLPSWTSAHGTVIASETERGVTVTMTRPIQQGVDAQQYHLGYRRTSDGSIQAAGQIADFLNGGSPPEDAQLRSRRPYFGAMFASS